MSRHSKNNTASAIFTYYERKKLKGFGSQKSRFGGENLRRFEDCWLCLRPAVKPVCTPGGYIYCKECLMVNFESQKEENDRKINQWEFQQLHKISDVQRLEKEKKKKEIASFLEANEGVVSHSVPKSKSTIHKRPSFVEMDKDASRAASFWVVENTPDVANSAVVADSDKFKDDELPPTKHLICPTTNVRLRLKDLVDLKPELLITTEGNVKWLCSLTKSEIGYHKAYAIRLTGQVVLEECLKQGLFKNVGKSSKDLIPLIPGGSGFSSHNKTETAVHRPVME